MQLDALCCLPTCLSVKSITLPTELDQNYSTARAYEHPPAGPMSCTGNTQWYVCSRGDFKGCCSSDPCGTGICPDSHSQGDSGSSQPLTSSASNPTTTTTPEHMAAVATTTASRSMDTSSSTLFSTQMTASASASPESAAATGGSMMDMHGDSSSMHNYHEGLIAGVITGCVVAVLLLVGILLWVWYRSRKKRGKGFTLLQWYGARYGRQRRGHSVSDRGHMRNRRRGEKNRGHTNTSPCTCCKPPASTGEVNTDTSTNMPVSNAVVNIGSTTPNSATSLLAQTPPSVVSSPERQFQPYQRAPLKTIPSPTLLHQRSQQPQDKDQGQKTTPELGDTGFYRPRIELATHPQSELINVPPGQRTRRHYHSPRLSPSPRPSPSSNHGLSLSHGHGQGAQLKHIVTPDGAILAANFERSSSGAREHATSFAEVPLGLGVDFAYTRRDIMRCADAVAENHGQDEEILPAYSVPFNNESRGDHTKG